MGCGKYNISDTCGERTYATCVFYQTDLPEWSELVEQNCVTIEETTEELYNEIDKLKDSLDTSELGNDCIDYTTNDDGDILIKDVLLVFEEKICDLESKSEGAGSPGSQFCSNLDFGDLIDPNDCDGKPTTWCEFAQFILNKLQDPTFGTEN